MSPALPSANQPKAYYDFNKYISRQRILTYWYQIKEVLDLHPERMLEIGVGTGLVTAFLRAQGVEVRTLDLNPELNPDHHGSVAELEAVFTGGDFPLILCARVLHHLPFEDFGRAVDQLAHVTSRDLVLTLPHEDFALYLGFRYTSSSQRTLKIPLPLWVKKALYWRRSRSGLWKIGDEKSHDLAAVRKILETRFVITRCYRIPEDPAHQVFVCRLR